MGNFPQLTGTQLLNAMRKAGFALIRTKGSHHFIQHLDGRCTVVPVHGGETVGIGLLLKILRDCDMTRDELRQYL